MIVWLKNTE